LNEPAVAGIGIVLAALWSAFAWLGEIKRRTEVGRSPFRAMPAIGANEKGRCRSPASGF
jgi:hypothetical protein